MGRGKAWETEGGGVEGEKAREHVFSTPSGGKTD